MSSRTPSDWDEDDWDEPVARPRRRAASSSRRVRTFGLPVVAAALVGGLFVGYVASSGGGGTTTITETRTVTAPAEATAGVQPAGEAARGTISLAILNGSGESGLAARTAEGAREIGYAAVTEGNAPSPVATDLVLHRQGAAPRAARVAEDLGLPAPELATSDDPVLASAPDADVIVVLGPTGAAPATTGDGASDGAADGSVDAPAADAAAAVPEG